MNDETWVKNIAVVVESEQNRTRNIITSRSHDANFFLQLLKKVKDFSESKISCLSMGVF